MRRALGSHAEGCRRLSLVNAAGKVRTPPGSDTVCAGSLSTTDLGKPRDQAEARVSGAKDFPVQNRRFRASMHFEPREQEASVHWADQLLDAVADRGAIHACWRPKWKLPAEVPGLREQPL